jgi:hypothetical protein
MFLVSCSISVTSRAQQRKDSISRLILSPGGSVAERHRAVSDMAWCLNLPTGV